MPNWKKVITSGSDAALNSLIVTTNLTSSGDFKLDGAFYDNNNTLGTSGQMLQSTGTGIIWTDNIAESAQDLVIQGKNMTLSTIEKGTPLYFSASGTTGNLVGVYPADAGNPSRMPAGGVAGEQLASEAEGDVFIYGFINGVDTSAFNSGDDVFVGVGGGYTNVKPTGSALIQKLGNVERSDASNGSGVIQGPSWYNDLPNIAENNVWLGDSDGVPQSVVSSSLLVDTASLALNVEYDNVLNKPTLISSSLQFNELSLPFTGSFTGSFTGDGSGLTNITDAASFTASFSSTGSVTINHGLDSKNISVDVYNENDILIIPDQIELLSPNTVKVDFAGPTSGFVSITRGGHLILTNDIAGFNRVFTQASPATTWSFNHALGNKYPQLMVFDSNDEVIIPGKIEAVDDNNLNIYFDTSQSGIATATVGGTATTASYADSFTIKDVNISVQENIDVDTGTETIATVSTTLHDGAFFDYVLKDGTNYRAGTIMSVWDGSSIEFTDNSTADIGNTSSVTMSMDISGTDARLRTTVSSDNWSIKTLIRAL